MFSLTEVIILLAVGTALVLAVLVEYFPDSRVFWGGAV
jgi:hypothetical protein